MVCPVLVVKSVFQTLGVAHESANAPIDVRPSGSGWYQTYYARRIGPMLSASAQSSSRPGFEKPSKVTEGGLGASLGSE